MSAQEKKEKKAPKDHVTPTVETNRIIREECATVTTKTKVDVKKVMSRFNCSHNDARLLALAAEANLVPSTQQARARV